MELYNFDKLIKVSYTNTQVSEYYIYKKYVKFLGIKFKIKKGIYDSCIHEYYGLEAPENYILKDEIVYHKPYIELFFDNNFKRIMYFDTYQEVLTYIEFIKKICKNLY